MDKIYISTYGVAFSDYKLLKKQIIGFKDFRLGSNTQLRGKIQIFMKNLMLRLKLCGGFPRRYILHL